MLGNLTRDPQLSFLPSQTPVVEFGLATNRRWTGQDGSQREETCFVDCQMFGKRAEVINKFFKKGSPIFIEGRLKFDSWQSQDGTKRSKLRVFIENFEFVGGGRPSGQGGYDGGSAGGSQVDGPVDDMDGPIDDIPF
jgi:single-strand DNA-binding protein